MRWLYLVPCLLALSCSASEKAAEERRENGTITFRPAVVDFIYYQRLIFVTLRLNGQGEFLFLLDTGASASAIDLALIERLNLTLGEKTEVEGTAGIVEAHHVHIDSISAGNKTVRDIVATGRDLSGLLAPPGRRVDGILGYDFLRHFSIRIDFADSTIILSRESFPTSADGRIPGTPVRFTLDNGIPRVTGRLNDSIGVDFRLDTGASIFETDDVYFNITEETWNRLTAATPDLTPEHYLTGSGVGGEVQLAVARIDRFSFGTATIDSPFVIVQPPLGYFANDDAVGFISNNLLEKFSPVVIDYLRTVLYLNKWNK